MDNTFNQQLNNEIEKLKVGDYTSYQNFYAQTQRGMTAATATWTAARSDR